MEDKQNVSFKETNRICEKRAGEYFKCGELYRKIPENKRSVTLCC